MAASDLRDVLNITAGPGAKRRPKANASRSHLKGLAREVHSLGGDNPISLIPPTPSFKKRRFPAQRRAATHWELRAFRNSARQDRGLVLRHWRRKDPTAPDHTDDQGRPADEVDDSAFAQFNVSVMIPRYNDEQYQLFLLHEDWTKAETDYLMQLVAEYDLRWPIIWDRYDFAHVVHALDGTRAEDEGESEDEGEMKREMKREMEEKSEEKKEEKSDEKRDGKSEESEGKVQGTCALAVAAPTRTMEELKARYYEVASKLMAVERPIQFMSPSELALHDAMASFDADQERVRKEFALQTMKKTREEVREEELLLLEIKRILARNERFNQDRSELYHRLDFPYHEGQQDLSAFKTSAGLQTLLQTLMNSEKNKKRKGSEMGTGSATPVADTPLTSTATTTTATSATAAATAAAAPPPSATSHRRDSSHVKESSLPAASSTSTPTAGRQKGGSASATAPASATTAATAPLSAVSSSAPAQPERRQLTDAEAQLYGVSLHDRLTSGASFRSERSNKLFASKSNQQQMRITNVLLELDVSPRLIMPTAAVSLHFEKLVHTIATLLDCRKLADKLEAEWRVERAKKAERERRSGRKKDAATQESTEVAKAATDKETTVKAATAEGGGSEDVRTTTEVVPTEVVPTEAVPAEEETSTFVDDGGPREGGVGEEEKGQDAAPSSGGTRGHDTTVGDTAVEDEDEDEERDRHDGGDDHREPLRKRSASMLSDAASPTVDRKKRKA